MKTYVHLPTGERYPEHGCQNTFQWEGWSGSRGKAEMFKRGKGWFRIKPKEWVGEVIPDLPEGYTREQWLEYAKTYGVLCAQEQLDCCDYMKPTKAFQMFNPPANEEKWKAAADWFKSVFKTEIWRFIDGLMLGMGNTYSIDIFKFERHLANEFNYPMHKDGSIHDFMVAKFGQEETDRFRSLFLNPVAPKECHETTS